MGKIGEKRIDSCVKALTLLLWCPLASAQNQWQSTESIRAAAVSHANSLLSRQRGDVTVAARQIDARLRLRQCAEPLQTYLPPGSTIANGGVVGVRCTGPVAWKLFVPVAVERYALVARSSRALPAGHRLQAQDIEWTRAKLKASDAVLIKDRDVAIDQVLRQPAAAGQTLRAAMLRPPHIIQRGDRVTLAVSNPNLAIRMRGEALADAALGQRVRARNDSSGRIVEGIVRARGLIELDIY